MYSFSSVEEMYRWSSSCIYMPNITVPMIFINSKDDPLVPEDLWTPAKKFVGKPFPHLVYSHLQTVTVIFLQVTGIAQFSLH